MLTIRHKLFLLIDRYSCLLFVFFDQLSEPQNLSILIVVSKMNKMNNL